MGLPKTKNFWVTLSLTLLLVTDLLIHGALLVAVQPIYRLGLRPELILRQAKHEIEEKHNITLPPVKLLRSYYSYDRYYEGDVLFNGVNILIFMNETLINDLSNQKLKAFFVHNLGHYVAGHLTQKSASKNSFSGAWVDISGDPKNQIDINKEIEADILAVGSVESRALADLIKELTSDPHERNARLQALGENQ